MNALHDGFHPPNVAEGSGETGSGQTAKSEFNGTARHGHNVLGSRAVNSLALSISLKDERIGPP